MFILCPDNGAISYLLVPVYSVSEKLYAPYLEVLPNYKFYLHFIKNSMS